MPDVRNDEKVKELVDEITNRTRELSDIVRAHVLQELINRLQARLDQLPRPDNTLPGRETESPEPTPQA
jgi:hypothetical protein